MEEKVPIGAPLKVIDSKTIRKGKGWWMAVCLVESFGKRQIGLYLWQKKKEVWRRKQKFGIQTKAKWKEISEAIEGFIPQLNR